MGTPEFAGTILENLISVDNEIALVITQPDRAKDRGKKIQFTPVKEIAIKNGIDVLQPERIKGNTEILEVLKNINPDIIVVAAYGQILPEEILNLPKYGCINVHASLLPKLRGASPIQMAIVTGETETGVTIMQMAKGLDTGDIITQEKIEIGQMNGDQLHDSLSEIGGKLLIDTMKLIEDGKTNPIKQDESKATYAGLITKKDGRIDFAKSPKEIECLIRGFDPWPGAFCYPNTGEDTPIKFWRAIATFEEAKGNFGEIIGECPEGIKINCGNKVLILNELQVPGKKRTLVKDYIRGNKLPNGFK